MSAAEDWVASRISCESVHRSHQMLSRYTPRNMLEFFPATEFSVNTIDFAKTWLACRQKFSVWFLPKMESLFVFQQDIAQVPFEFFYSGFLLLLMEPYHWRMVRYAWFICVAWLIKMRAGLRPAETTTSLAFPPVVFERFHFLSPRLSLQQQHNTYSLIEQWQNRKPSIFSSSVTELLKRFLCIWVPVGERRIVITDQLMPSVRKSVTSGRL